MTEDAELTNIFEQIDFIFLVTFTVEVIFQLIYWTRLDTIKFQCCQGRGDETGSGTERDGRNHSVTFGQTMDSSSERERGYCFKVADMMMITLPPKATAKEAKIHERNKPWIIFDLLVIVFSWAFNSVRIIRSFRILRALRLISKLRQMRNLVRALFVVMPRMGAVAFLLGILFIIFGVFFTEKLGRNYDPDLMEFDYFGRLDLTLFTLFQMMTFDNWQTVTREVSAVDPIGWVMCLIWVILSGFVVFNLIIAIICESLTSLDEVHSDALHGATIYHDPISETMGDDAALRSVPPPQSQGFTNREDDDALRRKVEALENTVNLMLIQQKEMLRMLQS